MSRHMNAGVLQVHIPAQSAQINSEVFLETYGWIVIFTITIVILIPPLKIGVHYMEKQTGAKVRPLTTAVAAVEAPFVPIADMENSQLMPQLYVLIVKLENIKINWHKVNVKIVLLEKILQQEA